jgi:hypothetical protein
VLTVRGKPPLLLLLLRLRRPRLLLLLPVSARHRCGPLWTMSNVWSEYVAGLIESLADSITTLKVIEIPQAVSHQYMGFLELPGEFCLNLQPGDAMKVNFNVEESESHTG